ncbi:MAG: bifunctional phosphoserine phosphatase/homoserine phosphotransferase ThrH [Rickettsiales bacterium]|nr:bifunctional phosphoserine phosphatase/homoserine phosphotransferase ThrH [Rickettsiales bacterium]OUV81285.1 MAG: bifunctional phosphoserine phosphatase/homoserine phosphotransferase ThrH [Rickettsiales bacterium TMED131]|tara:strand:- start:21 stop:635 length:615 start_codon:yes stop_codon:yes gene_type:complete
MNFIGIDLEGVLIPEIWVSLSEKTGIKDLQLTTKDVSDYKELMKIRIELLSKNSIEASLLFDIASKINPYEGALEFLTNIRKKYQVIILSDTFFNLSSPVFQKLNYPTVFCHELLVDDNNMISGMKMCIEEHKRYTLKYMNALNFNTVAIGDSLNDLGMLSEANIGILFKSSKTIIKNYSQYFSCNSFDVLYDKINTIFEGKQN